MSRFFNIFLCLTFFVFIYIGHIDAAKKTLLSANEREYDGIIAIVNGDIVTAIDLEERLNLALSSLGSTIDEKSKSKLRAEILREMIDEKLKIQHANKFAPKGGWVSKEVINHAFDNLARSNGLSSQEFTDLLKSKRVKKEVLLDQISADLSWVEYIKARFGRRSNIPSYETKKTLAEVREKLMKEAFYISRMFFPFSDSIDEKSVFEHVSNLYHILINGADFANVARQFSKSSDAVNGGELGWVFEGQLSSVEINALKDMRVGSYKIVKNNKGYVILHLKDKKTEGLRTYTSLKFVQVVLPFGKEKPPQEHIDEALAYINVMKKTSKNCTEFIKKVKETGFIGVSDPTSGVLETMQPKFKQAIAKVPIGGISEAVVFDAGILVICLLDKKNNTVKEPTEDDIKSQKIDDRMNSAARNELNYLKRKSYISLNKKYANVAEEY